MREKQLAAWRAAVMKGETEQDFESWLADQDNLPRYVVAIGEVSVYHFIDIDDGSVVRVVADDFTLTPIDDMQYRYTNSQLQIMHSECWPSATDIGLAMKILDDNDGPAWEFGWDQL